MSPESVAGYVVWTLIATIATALFLAGVVVGLLVAGGVG